MIPEKLDIRLMNCFSGLECEDIYRLGGLKSKANAIRREIDSGEEVSIHKYHPHVIAALLKQFLK